MRLLLLGKNIWDAKVVKYDANAYFLPLFWGL